MSRFIIVNIRKIFNYRERKFYVANYSDIYRN